MGESLRRVHSLFLENLVDFEHRAMSVHILRCGSTSSSPIDILQTSILFPLTMTSFRRLWTRQNQSKVVKTRARVILGFLLHFGKHCSHVRKSFDENANERRTRCWGYYFFYVDWKGSGKGRIFSKILVSFGACIVFWSFLINLLIQFCSCIAEFIFFFWIFFKSSGDSAFMGESLSPEKSGRPMLRVAVSTTCD